MNVIEMADNIATKHGMEKKAAKAVVEAVFAAMTEAAKAGDEVSIPGFGKFKVASREARSGPQPGHRRDHPDRRLQEARLHPRQAAEGLHERRAGRQGPGQEGPGQEVSAA